MVTEAKEEVKDVYEKQEEHKKDIAKVMEYIETLNDIVCLRYNFGSTMLNQREKGITLHI